MPIYRDTSDTSVVLTCSDCPGWAALRLDPIEAYKAGEEHEINVHGVEPARAERPRILYQARRHAVIV